MASLPKTQYAKSGDLHVAYRMTGSGRLAGPRKALVSGTLRNLVPGFGMRFEERRVHPLEGPPGEWRLFAVSPSS
jgi:hypothetical protein